MGPTPPAATRVPAPVLFRIFLRLGLTAFGGPAMVAYIREQVVVRHRWVEEEVFAEGVALCQMIPGATAMQAAAYAGLRAGGPAGALAAYLGFGLPAFLLMVVFASLYQQAHGLAVVAAAFVGLKAIVCAIVANATFTFGRKVGHDPRDLGLAIGAALFLAAGGSPIVAIGVAALFGLLLFRGRGGGGCCVSEGTGTRPLFRGRGGGGGGTTERGAGGSGGGGGKGGATAGAALAPSGATRTALLLAGGLALLLLLLLVLDRPLFHLAAMMVRVDLFAFGGGYASLPLLLHEVVEVRHWLDPATFMDGIALGQVTPGPIVITATFVGQLVAGLAGAGVATVGILTPSLVVVLAAAGQLDRLRKSAPVQRALRGVLATFVGLLAAVCLHFLQTTPWSPVAVTIAVAALAALRAGVDLLGVVAGGAALAAWLL